MKNTCAISAFYFESRNDKFCLIGSVNCACSNQPVQNHGLAVALGQVVIALSRTNPLDFGLGKNIVFFLFFFPSQCISKFSQQLTADYLAHGLKMRENHVSIEVA